MWEQADYLETEPEAYVESVEPIRMGLVGLLAALVLVAAAASVLMPLLAR